MVVTAFQQKPPPPGTWSASVERIGGSAKTEIGILAKEDTVEPERISLGGFLTTIGESAQPGIYLTSLSVSVNSANPSEDPTRFSFPSRHHACPPNFGTTYSTSFPHPRGLHPILRLTFPSTPMPPPLPSCALHTYIILPSPVFPDKYQLSSSLFLASQNLRSLRSVSGETDLEAPNWVISKWGSTLLVELAPPPTLDSSSPSEWHASIPLHLRYLPPTSNGTSSVSIPWPIVFWACPNDEGAKMNTNPFDRVNLGFESLFGQRTMFYHLQPAQASAMSNVSGQLVENLLVPVLVQGWESYVETGTVGCVLFGVLWLIWKLLGQKERRRVLHPKAEWLTSATLLKRIDQHDLQPVTEHWNDVCIAKSPLLSPGGKIVLRGIILRIWTCRQTGSRLYFGINTTLVSSECIRYVLFLHFKPTWDKTS